MKGKSKLPIVFDIVQCEPVCISFCTSVMAGLGPYTMVHLVKDDERVEEILLICECNRVRGNRVNSQSYLLSLRMAYLQFWSPNVKFATQRANGFFRFFVKNESNDS